MVLLSIRFKNDLESLEKKLFDFKETFEILSEQDWTKLSKVTLKKTRFEELNLVFEHNEAAKLLISANSKDYIHRKTFNSLHTVSMELEQFFYGFYKSKLNSDFDLIGKEEKTKIPNRDSFKSKGSETNEEIENKPHSEPEQQPPLNESEDPKKGPTELKDPHNEKQKAYRKRKSTSYNSSSKTAWHTAGLVISMSLALISVFRACDHSQPSVHPPASKIVVKKLSAIITKIEESTPNSPFKSVTYKFIFLGKPMERTSLDFSHKKSTIHVGDTVKIRLSYDDDKKDFVPSQIFFLED